MNKMTNEDCLAMYGGLQTVKQPAFADIKNFEDKDDYVFHSKFVRAVSYNKKQLQPIIESLQEAEKLSDEYKEYLKQRDEILAEFSKKDKDGNPEEKTNIVGGIPRKSYNVPSLHDKTSDVSKRIKKLEKDNEEIIEARKTQEKQMKEMLKEEVDFKPMLVPWSMIPNGLDTPAMDGIMFMIDETNEEPERKPKSKK